MHKYLTLFVFIFLCSTSYSQNKTAQQIEESYNLNSNFYAAFEEDGPMHMLIWGWKDCENDGRLFLFKQNPEIVDFEESFELIQSIPFLNSQIVLADINGNGTKELLSQRFGQGANAVSIYSFENGKLHFQKDVVSNAINQSAIATDIDNDGREEILSVSIFFASYVEKISFDDDFNLTSEFDFAPLPFQGIHRLVDLDGNGSIDIWSTKDEGITVSLLEGSEIIEVIETSNSYDLRDGFHDLNGNGEMDILYTKPNEDSLFIAVDFHENLFANSYAVSPSSSSSFLRIDIDEDGDSEHYVDWNFFDRKVVTLENGVIAFSDITIENAAFTESVYANYYNNGIHKQVYAGDGSIIEYSKYGNHFIGKHLHLEIENFRHLEHVQYADIDQDNILDKVLIFEMLDGSFTGYKKGISSGFLHSTTKLANKLPEYKFKGMGDLNNDGIQDLVYTTDSKELFISIAETNGDFAESESIDNIESSSDQVLIQDFDNNGWNDIFVFDAFTEPFVLYNSQSGFIKDNASFPVGFSNAVPTAIPGTSSSILGRLFDDIGLQRFYEDGTSDYTLLDDALLVDGRFIELFDFNGDNLHEVLIEDNSKEDSISYLVVKLTNDYSALEIMARTPFLPKDFFSFASVLIHDFDEDNYFDIILAVRDEDDDIVFHELHNVNDTSFDYKGRIDNFHNININYYSISALDFKTVKNKDASNTNIYYYYCSDFYEVNSDNSPQIRGILFFDNNENGTIDIGESPIANTKINFESDNTKRTIVSNDDGTYAIGLENGQYTISIDSDNCHESYQNTISHNSNVTVENIGLKPNGLSSDIKIHLTNGPPRCGFSVPYWLKVENNSCDPLNGTVKITFDDRSPMFDILGEAFPKTDDGYSIEFNDLLPGASLKYDFLVEMPDFNFVGQVIKDEITIENELGELVKQKIFSNTIRCAIDPNDKRIKPDRTAEFDEQYITDEELLYTIRFQNVGNDTAINIVVIDTISPLLDFNSLEIEAFSHPNTIEIDDKRRTLIVNFENIYLVDSIANEPGSHGFISFSIKPIENLNDNDQIENKAGIYFDFNPPIITNTLKSTFLNDLSILNSTTDKEEGIFSIHPNPTLETFSITFPDNFDPPSVELLDVTGRKIKNLKLDYKNSYSLEGVNPGLYLLQLSTMEKKETIKLIKL